MSALQAFHIIFEMSTVLAAELNHSHIFHSVAFDIRNYANKTVRMIGWGIAAKILSAKNNRKPMKMLTLEDRTGTYEATLFPRIYANSLHALSPKGRTSLPGKSTLLWAHPHSTFAALNCYP